VTVLRRDSHHALAGVTQRGRGVVQRLKSALDNVLERLRPMNPVARRRIPTFAGPAVAAAVVTLAVGIGLWSESAATAYPTQAQVQPTSIAGTQFPCAGADPLASVSSYARP
jgi:hypothetical protein